MIRWVLLLTGLLGANASVSAADTRVPTSLAQVQLSFAPLVKEASPAVVNIYARRVVQDRRRSPFADDPFFGPLFRDLGPSQPRVQNSLGSGVILSADGLVVSNYHVVGTATDIRVVLNDRREYQAKVLLGDEESDLAILQLDGARNMPHLTLRSSDTVEVGELVLAIGNPFGVGQTVSSGIVSGLARSGTATGNARGYFIQTDAPINPGNSGGALIDVSGRLIGVNTSILTRSGGSNGIGFAIPSDLVAQFVTQARAGNTQFQRPWAGLSGQPVDMDLSETLGRPRPGGVVISDMHPDSPFADAGLRRGDVVLEVDGEPVNTPAEMYYRMSVRGIGASAKVLFARGAKTATVSVAMIQRPSAPQPKTITLGDKEVLTGTVVTDVTAEMMQAFRLPRDTKGVVVLDPGQRGRRVGLRRGDVIVAVDGREVTRAARLGETLQRAAPSIRLDGLRGRQILRFRFRL